MYSKDFDLINNFHINLAHSRNSIKTYNTVFNKYRNFHNMSLTDLLMEDYVDQENHVPEHRLKLTHRLNSFKNWLIENHINNTVLSSFAKIKTFYRCHGIRLPYIPPINSTCLNKNDFITFNDLITKEEIVKVVSVCDDDFRNWILFMLSSGSAKIDCFNITNEMFYHATYQYHHKSTFKGALKSLSGKDDVVVYFKLKRQKTSVPYLCFISPECVRSIAETKLRRKDYNLGNYLLRHDTDWLGRTCRFYNEYFGFGKSGGYVRLRPHMFRKFFATHLTVNRNIVDVLQGRCKSKTHNAYFKDNPDLLKIEYVRGLDNLSLFHTYTYEVIDSELQVYSKKHESKIV